MWTPLQSFFERSSLNSRNPTKRERSRVSLRPRQAPFRTDMSFLKVIFPAEHDEPATPRILELRVFMSGKTHRNIQPCMKTRSRNAHKVRTAYIAQGSVTECLIITENSGSLVETEKIENLIRIILESNWSVLYHHVRGSCRSVEWSAWPEPHVWIFIVHTTLPSARGQRASGKSQASCLVLSGVIEITVVSVLLERTPGRSVGS